MSLRKLTSEILDPHQKLSGASFVVDILLSALIVMNIIAISIESIQGLHESFLEFLNIFELFSVFIFTVEYLTRLWTAPERSDLRGKTATEKRLQYVFSFIGMIDLAVIVPFFLNWFVPIIDLRWVRVLRLFWLFKFSHFSPALELFAKAVFEERKSLSSTMYLLLIVISLSSSMIYFAENKAQPEVFYSIPESLWWSTMTLTTVGYGDAYPITSFGKIIAVFTALSGLCAFAMLTGILSTAFYNQLERRKSFLKIEIEEFLKDGKIDENEMIKIKKLQKELNLSDEHIKAVIKIFSNQLSPEPLKNEK
jgi:voltage-gated potassium channel